MLLLTKGKVSQVADYVSKQPTTISTNIKMLAQIPYICKMNTIFETITNKET